MEIIWLPLAEQALEAIFFFYEEKSFRAAQKIIANILQATEVLAIYPEMATIEPLLSDYPEAFRSLVVKKTYKVVYYVGDTGIFIADVWDCRQNPQKLKSKITKVSPNPLHKRRL